MNDADVAGAARADDEVNHLCWVYEDPADFRARAAAFLAAGLAAGHRLEYLAAKSDDALRRDVALLSGADALIDGGRLTLRSLESLYGPDDVVDPVTTVAAYDAATREAIAHGYRGLCVVAEATPLVRSAAQREAFARYEHLVDGYMRRSPFFAMCAYDANVLDAGASAEIACVHSHISPGAAPFQWSSATGADVRLVGEVDIVGRELFDRTLARTLPMLRKRHLVVDASGLSFIDQHAFLTLERHARATATTVTLCTDTRLVHRLAALLHADAVQVQPA